MNKYWIRYKRYAQFMFNYVFKEKIRGLDFTMRDMHLLKESGGKFHGYSITPKKHLMDIFSTLSIDENCNLIDIGCGKGFVLWHARAYSFNKIVGIDIDDHLINRANKNIHRLKLKNVQAIATDAIKFNQYNEFNFFFFSNPFNREIFKDVLDKILKSLEKNPRKITVIYYHPTCADLFTDSNKFILKHTLYDPIKDYDTFIYESVL